MTNICGKNPCDCDELECQIIKLKKQIGLIKKSLILLNDNLNDQADTIDGLKVQISQLTIKIDALERNVSSLREDVGTLRIDVDALRRDVGILRTDVDTLRRDVTNLSTTVANQGNQISILQEQITDLNTAFEALIEVFIAVVGYLNLYPLGDINITYGDSGSLRAATFNTDGITKGINFNSATELSVNQDGIYLISATISTATDLIPITPEFFQVVATLLITDIPISPVLVQTLTYTGQSISTPLKLFELTTAQRLGITLVTSNTTIPFTGSLYIQKISEPILNTSGNKLQLLADKLKK